jgi:hypothetical protein
MGRANAPMSRSCPMMASIVDALKTFLDVSFSPRFGFQRHTSRHLRCILTDVPAAAALPVMHVSLAAVRNHFAAKPKLLADRHCDSVSALSGHHRWICSEFLCRMRDSSSSSCAALHLFFLGKSLISFRHASKFDVLFFSGNNKAREASALCACTAAQALHGTGATEFDFHLDLWFKVKIHPEAPR